MSFVLLVPDDTNAHNIMADPPKIQILFSCRKYLRSHENQRPPNPQILMELLTGQRKLPTESAPSANEPRTKTWIKIKPLNVAKPATNLPKLIKLMTRSSLTIPSLELLFSIELTLQTFQNCHQDQLHTTYHFTP